MRQASALLAKLKSGPSPGSWGRLPWFELFIVKLINAAHESGKGISSHRNLLPMLTTVGIAAQLSLNAGGPRAERFSGRLAHLLKGKNREEGFSLRLFGGEQGASRQHFAAK